MPAVSKKQQRFMGMVHATQKGEIDAPSAAVADAAKSIDPGDAKDFASTSTKGLPLKKESLARRLSSFINKKSDMTSSLMGGLKNVGNTASTLWGRLSPKAQQAIIGAAIGGGVGGIGGSMVGGPEHRGRGALLGALLGAGAGGYGGYALGNRQMQQESSLAPMGRGITQMGRELALPNDSMFKRYRTPMQMMQGLYKKQSVHEASPAGLLVMLKFAERPSNSLIGLLAVTRAGESIKEANHLTKQASAEGTMEFINKAASITDAPSSNALADYVDCAVIMNPEISYLNKFSEALRSTPSINEAIKQAYPKVPTQMRVKIASKVIMDYLQARAIVGQLCKQATYPGCGSGMKKKKSLKLKKNASADDDTEKQANNPMDLVAPVAAISGGGGLLTALLSAAEEKNKHRPAAAALEGGGLGMGAGMGAGYGAYRGAGLGRDIGEALGYGSDGSGTPAFLGLLAGGALGGLGGGTLGHLSGKGLSRILGVDHPLPKKQDMAAAQMAQ